MSAQGASLRGLAFGRYAEREAAGDGVAVRDVWRALRSRFTRQGAAALEPASALMSRIATLAQADAGDFEATLAALRGRLRRDGLAAADTDDALVLVSAAMQRTLGKTPYATQLRAAQLLLAGRLVEMATGEGKTLAAALAAAVAAMAGVPVHVLTANDYLARRDRDTLAPLYDALGLTSGCVTGATPREQRGAIYRAAIVHATARELAFDYLHDHNALGGERDPRVLRAAALDGADHAAAPVLPGLAFAVIDEADSILLDEATVPLILAAPCGTIDAEAYRRAYELACTLQRQRDYQLLPAERRAALTDAGRERIGVALRGTASGALRPLRRAHELVEAALAARLLMRRDREYAVTPQGLQLIDEITGRIAEGRQWTGALHPMVEIKEGLAPSPPTATSAQITYQRFFARYLHIGGMSGTLHEARHELEVSYGAGVTRVPLAQANRRQWLGEQVFVSAQDKAAAVLAAVRREQARGRPVLVGTDSVAASVQLSAQLSAAGVAHQVLNALQDADEAARIAHAGERGVVTVATNIAGRGTDICLAPGVIALGGLHVIAMMRNRSRRIDRQLLGRSARQGDPGSAERVLALDDALLRRAAPVPLRRIAARLARNGRVPKAVAAPLFAIAQHLAEWHDQRLRRRLRRAERHVGELYAFAGGTE